MRIVIVNAYLAGKIAYTGEINRAATRFRISPEKLRTATTLPRPPQRRQIWTSEGFMWVPDRPELTEYRIETIATNCIGNFGGTR